ncbi:hypothetical protein [Planomonospora parontospora]|uniref:hypothetical protein n=1 Tax=Planomonospora parontospora TaxID=58119 RepID=UPI0016717CCF|nr:hypothetical protein [Planomonospora parontospora]GGL15000.1 hypothetical protein GCM10014719_16210 [Planomonospora parontospora subsp. antibiotica]GII15896.1 hypothetical protein Ppa05_26220 [Planomonospora parontospora subsp. antibiotica]
MMRKLFFAVVLAVATAGSTTAWAEVPAPSATGSARIAFHKSGGFAGIDQAITITRDGAARVRGTARSAEFRLTDDEFRSLRRELDAVSTWRSSSAGCDIADHFTYTLSHRGRQATRCHEVPADWRPAIARLEGLIDRALAGRAVPRG